MSRAFDTISRSRLLDILREDVKLDEDELRMCQALLAETYLQVRIKDVLAKAFQTTIGTPQGDALSPVLFAVYLEHALRELRSKVTEKPKEDLGIPTEALYADDCDFFSTCDTYLKNLEDTIPPTIRKYDLMANESKWERTKINKDTSEWKKVKKLGSLLGDDEDVERRMQLATIQFKALEKMWDRTSFIKLKTRMHTYIALVQSVLLYNASTWGLRQDVLNKLDTFHRKHLRRIVGIRWPQRISNKELYKLCNVQPLSITISRLRWQLFGHILRLDPNTPAQIAMDYYCTKSIKCLKSGRAKTTLPILLFNEFHNYKQSFKKSSYRQQHKTALKELRKVASDRIKWRKVVDSIVSLNLNDYSVEYKDTYDADDDGNGLENN